MPERAAKWLQTKREWLGLLDITLKVPDKEKQKPECQDEVAQLSTEIQDPLHVRTQNVPQNSQQQQKESENSDSSFLKSTIKMILGKMRAAVSIASAGIKSVLKFSVMILEKIEQKISVIKAARVLGCIGKFIPVINLL